MASKEDKESALEAKIAAIRAKNLERERRSLEVKNDRLEAERSQSSVTNIKTGEVEGTESVGEHHHDEDNSRDSGFRNPYGSSSSANSSSSKVKKAVHERINNSKQQPQNSSSSNREDLGHRRSRGRLADEDGPPPDPGYSFLADRMRDGSPVEDPEDSRKKQNNRQKRGEPHSRRSGGGGSRQHQDENVSPKHKNRNKIEERIAQNIRDIREETSNNQAVKTSNIKPLMPEGFVPGGGKSRSTAQARLDRSRHQRDQNGSSESPPSSAENNSNNFPTEPWKCPDPSCAFTNRPRVMRCAKCGFEWASNLASRYANANRKVIEMMKNDGKKEIKVKVQFDRSEDNSNHSGGGNDQQHQALHAEQQHKSLRQPELPPQQQPPVPLQAAPQQQLLATTPSFQPTFENQWQPMPANEWVEQPQQSMVIGHWENPQASVQQIHGAPPGLQQIDNWTYAADPAQSDPGWIQPQHQHLQHQTAAAMYPGAHQQYMIQPAYQEPPSNMMIPQEYLPMPHQQSHHQALTQITHATQHSMPIMATQQFVAPAPATASTGTKENSFYGRGFSRPSATANTSDRGGSSSNSSNTPSSRNMNWRNPEKEVTRIPPRFQKQRPLHQHSASSGKQSPRSRMSARDRNLPRATSRSAPSTANRLTVFGTSNVVNNLSESQLSEALFIPVRLISAMKLKEFKEKISLVEPEFDRIVLIHGLGNDARNIAVYSNKSDVDKGAESDDVAHDFADTILDLIERIPYVKVLISTLLPRFDHEEQLNMSCPNNVRKVMNVEISMKLQDKPNVEFINNDTVLEWWKDDVKKKRLFRHDGYHLSAYGFSMMLEHWMKTLKVCVTSLGLINDGDSTSASPDDDEPPPLSTPETGSSLKNTYTTVSDPIVVRAWSDPPVDQITSKVEDVKLTPPAVAETEVDQTEDDEVPLPNDDEDTKDKKKVEEIVVVPVPKEDKKAEEIEIPLPTSASDDDEFHEASESPTPVDIKTNTNNDEEFKEKENEEKMEKELT